jgi:mono/diheme cytochrome c family protein
MNKLIYRSLILCSFAIINLLAQTKPVVSGLKVFEDNCLTCHQGDGMGVPGMTPPLSKTKWVLGDKKELISIVSKGLNTPMEVNGETYYSPMPAHGHLTDAELAAVLTYVRSNFGNKANPVTEAEVKKVRSVK